MHVLFFLSNTLYFTAPDLGQGLGPIDKKTQCIKNYKNDELDVAISFSGQVMCILK